MPCSAAVIRQVLCAVLRCYVQHCSALMYAMLPQRCLEALPASVVPIVARMSGMVEAQALV
jgi:hypothetical protein